MNISVLRKHLSGGFVSVLALLLFPFTASAVSVGTYTLGNHPAAHQAPPPYGIRLDGFLGFSVYTFDFEHPSSNMHMTYNGSTIIISGSAFGGSDNGTDYDAGSTALWSINSTFDTQV